MELPVPMQLDTRILVFAGSPEQRDAALRAGADIAGGDELLNDLLEDRLQFDRVIAHLDALPLVTRLARVLGPRGLMPSTKTGTLTADLEAALRDARTRVAYRVEKFTGLFNIPVARVSSSN